MTKVGKIIRWICAIGALPCAYYTFTGFIYFSWLNAYDPEIYTVEKVSFQVYSYLALTIVLIILFFYCIVTLIKETNRAHSEKHNAI